MLLPYVEWIEASALGTAIRESTWAFAFIESIHLLALSVIGGAVLLVDLRLLNRGLKNMPLLDLARDAWKWQKLALVALIITGILLFYAIPVRSYQNIFFRIKVVMLILAGINAWLFHRGIYRRLSEWDAASVVPARARRAGILSLVLWTGIIVSGRMIAYNWFDCDLKQSAFITWAAGCTPHEE